MMSVPVAATAMSFKSRASAEFSVALSMTTLLVTAIDVSRQSLRGFAGSGNLMNGAIPGFGEASERDVAVGGGVEKDDARSRSTHRGSFP